MQTFAERNSFGNAQIYLEEAWSGEGIAAEISVAAGGRRNAGNREGGESVCEASAGHAESDARNELRRGGATDRGARLRSAEVEAGVPAGDNVVRAARSDFDDRR